MYKLDDDTIVVVVSDVHVGAMINHHAIFIEFLKQVGRNPKNLKAVIILGDFFDVIMESVRDYCRRLYFPGGSRDEHTKSFIYMDEKTRNYDKIFLGLKKLQDREIRVFFTLGNHEIKIIG
ncbi:hypothetical protein LCGC14_2079100, partial [marine sediment metagenome]